MNNRPKNAKLVGGMWLPDTEEHFVHMMTKDGKQGNKYVNGKLTYQYHKFQACMNIVPENRRRICIDIGSHVGLWGIHLTQAFEHVMAFEPCDHFADLWEYNVEDKYTLYRYALGDHEGNIGLVIPPEMTGNTHVHGEGDIPLKTLDSFGFEEVDFIKIDVEGYELSVVKGAKETLLREKPFMVIEQKGNDQKFFGGQRHEASNWLKSLGMRDIKVVSGDHIMGW